MKPLRFGIAGVGGQGRKHLLNCLRLKNTKVVAAADSSKTVLTKISNLRIRAYQDYHEMITKEKLDAVIISLPNHLHEDCSIIALENGCDILIEKPLARNSIEARNIADHARKTGRKLMVGMSHRFIKGCQKLKEEIDADMLGRIDFASGLFFTGPFFQGRRVSEWMFDPVKMGGGALLDAGCHIIDLFLWFFGEVKSVVGYTESLFDLGYEDYAEVLMRFKNGVNALTVVSWRTRIPSYRIEVAGEFGRRIVMSKKFGIFDIGLRKGLLSFMKETVFQKMRGQPFLPLGDDIYYKELSYFAKCLHSDEEPNPNANDWLKVADIIDLVYRQTQGKRATQ